MRGIAGIIHLDQSAPPPEAIGRMIQTMAIGPTDRIQCWREESAGLAHLVKNIFEEDRFEAQPLCSADGNLVLVTDAMLQNRNELTATFGWHAHEAAILPDSAFVLAAYERWGEKCPAHLEGSFALAIWHRRERRLFCAVDHRGCRPFYFWRNSNSVAFATTFKGLFALRQIPRQLDADMFAAHVVGIPAAEPTTTLYRDIKRLPAGHCVRIDDTGCRMVRYWNPDPTRILRLRSDSEYLESFRDEFERAVRTSLQRGRGNVGIMLSGGLDSAAVAAVAGKILAEQGRRLQAFHTVPQSGNRYHAPLRELDESRFVESMRAHSPHIDFHFVTSQSQPVPLEDWDAAFENEFVPFRGLPSREGRELGDRLDQLDIGVLLNGLGGNDLVSLESRSSGYLTHLLSTGRWLTWAGELHGHSQVYGHPLRSLLRHTAINPVKSWLRRGASTLDTDRIFLLQPAFRKLTGIESRFRRHMTAQAALPWDFRRQLHRTLTVDMVQQSGVTGSIIKPGAINRFGAAPMFDRRLNEFCATLPPDQQIRDGWDRRLLRESMRGILPDTVRLRVTRGFPQPQFQRLFTQIEPMLRSEFHRLKSNTCATQYLDFNRLDTLQCKTRGKSSMTEEMTIVTTVVLARFLEWHENH